MRETFIKAVEEKNLRDVRIKLAKEMEFDPRGETFQEMLLYAEENLDPSVSLVRRAQGHVRESPLRGLVCRSRSSGFGGRVLDIPHLFRHLDGGRFRTGVSREADGRVQPAV